MRTCNGLCKQTLILWLHMISGLCWIKMKLRNKTPEDENTSEKILRRLEHKMVQFDTKMMVVFQRILNTELF